MFRPPPHRPDTRNPQQGNHRQGRKGFAAPDKGPAASAVRTRNFSLLATAAGDEEALGVALGLPLARIKELREGYGFSNETAFHIESELSLPSGWLDRPNATVSASVFSARNASDAPVESVAPAEASGSASAAAPASAPATAPRVAAQPDTKESPVLKEPKAHNAPGKQLLMLSAPGLVTGASAAPPTVVKAAAVSEAPPARKVRAAKPQDAAKAARKTPPATSALPSEVAAPAAAVPAAPPVTPTATASSVKPKETPMPRGPRINEPEDMMERRRANIMVLTDFAGGKTGIGKLLGKSPANISHVLHGKKKFTREVGQEFETALRLPAGWLDEPRQAGDVPDHVKNLILEAFNRKEDTPAAPRAAAPKVSRAPKSAVSPARAALASPGQSPARAAVNEMLTGKSSAPSPGPVVARQVVSQPAVPAQLAVEMSQLGDNQARPIAQALVRVIILLSRSNELPEDKCLKLLNEVTLMATPQSQG